MILLEETYGRLQQLSLKQDDLLRQSLRCIEHELYRAAHVMAWAAFMDFIEERISADGLKRVRRLRPDWKAGSIVELRESVVEYQILELTKDVGLCSKNEVKALQGLLNKRNECAHPSGYYPALNDTLGYVTEIILRIGQLRPRPMKLKRRK